MTGTSLIVRTAQRFGVDADKLMVTLKATAFKSDKPISNETMMALLIVADQYKLNPFTKEIYAFPDKRGGIVPVVGIDGWLRIINEHPMYDGMATAWNESERSYTCSMYRKDRSHPIVITEYMDECARGTEPWKTHPRRMLRHKTIIQAARVAFGFAGIFDEDEAERIAESRVEAAASPAPSVARVREVLAEAADVNRANAQLPDGAIDVVDVEPVMPTDPAENLAEMMRNLTDAEDEEQAQLVVEEARAWLTPDQHIELQRAFAARYSREPIGP